MGRFLVNYHYRGRSIETIEAESLEAAQAAIEAKVDGDDFELEPDEIEDVDFNVQQMYPVTRRGKEMWTTYVATGDVRGHQSELLTTPLFAGRA